MSKDQTTDPEVSRLLRLKRYETPGDEYFDEFLEEFQRRQRSALLKQSSFRLFCERVSTWLGEMSFAKWVTGAAVAYATIALSMLLWPAPEMEIDGTINGKQISGPSQLFPPASGAPLDAENGHVMPGAPTPGVIELSQDEQLRSIREF